MTDNHFDVAVGGADMVQKLSDGADMVQNSRAPKSKNPAKREVLKSAEAPKSNIAPPAGLEPATNGLTVREQCTKSPAKRDADGVGTANTQQEIPIDPELSRILEEWSQLPDPIKMTIKNLMDIVAG